MTPPEIIAKLEAAERGSRDLTADVYQAFGFSVIRTPRRPGGIAWRYRGHMESRWLSMRDLTESLDAALTLVPEGWRLHILAEHYSGWSANLRRKFGSEAADEAVWKRGHHWPSEHSSGTVEKIATAPLALCVVAIKARSAS